jgi:hypothetical protein
MGTSSMTNTYPFRLDDLYNLPCNLDPEDRGRVYADILSAYAEQRTIDILEIGVFRAGLITSLRKYAPQIIRTYTGVDPYIGDDTDPYFNSYWKSQKSEADMQYEKSLKIYNNLGGTLIRSTSDKFFLDTDHRYDAIIVDGDHRVIPTIRDLRNSLARLRPGGLLVSDDYGNPDAPEVTPGVVRFCESAGEFYDAAGFRPVWFRHPRKPAPIQLTVIYWRKKSVSS